MSKKIAFLFIAGFIICTAFIMPPTDYRDAYVGNYTCSSKCKTVKSDLSGYEINNSLETIAVAKDNVDSILVVSIGHSTYKVKLKNNMMSPSRLSENYRGSFYSTDSIAFSLSGTMNVSGCSYKGKKQ